MATPTIADPPAASIGIDPGVAYTYVIPAEDYTSLGFVPHDNFDISITGRVMTIEYVGPLVTDLTYEPEIMIFASNNEGTTEQTITFKPTTAPKITVKLTDSDSDILFGTDVATYLAVNDLVQFESSDDVDSDISGRLLYVKTVSSPNFKVSETLGGTAIASPIPGLSTIANIGIWPNAYTRAYPEITSAAELSAAPAEVVSYTITADQSPDGYFAQGLPDGLSVNSTTGAITGNAPIAPGFYPIILQAWKEDALLASAHYANSGAAVQDTDTLPVVSSRYLLLTVTAP